MEVVAVASLTAAVWALTAGFRAVPAAYVCKACDGKQV
eukprot:gene3166-20040_t